MQTFWHVWVGVTFGFAALSLIEALIFSVVLYVIPDDVYLQFNRCRRLQPWNPVSGICWLIVYWENRS